MSHIQEGWKQFIKAGICWSKLTDPTPWISLKVTNYIWRWNITMDMPICLLL